MTPQEKAKELVDWYLNFEIAVESKYEGYLPMKIEDAKEFALKQVDDIINLCSQVEPWLELEYYQQVKTEIEKL